MSTRMTARKRRTMDADGFCRPTLVVARDLLGKVLVADLGGRRTEGMITEVEAYDGPDDKASHAHRGRTQRNGVMFGPGGSWYVYLVYGMHWMLNIVTGPADFPAAVLIRGVGAVSGPGRVTRALGIDGGMDGKRAVRRSGLWIEDRGLVIPDTLVATTPRIGVDYAGSWAAKPYRFVCAGAAGHMKRTT